MEGFSEKGKKVTFRSFIIILFLPTTEWRWCFCFKWWIMEMNARDKINKCEIMVIIAMVTKFPCTLESKGLWYSTIGQAWYHWPTAYLLTITLLWITFKWCIKTEKHFRINKGHLKRKRERSKKVSGRAAEVLFNKCYLLKFSLSPTLHSYWLETCSSFFTSFEAVFERQSGGTHPNTFWPITLHCQHIFVCGVQNSTGESTE